MLISCSTLVRDPNPNLVLYCDLVRVLRRLRDGRVRLFFLFSASLTLTLAYFRDV